MQYPVTPVSIEEVIRRKSYKNCIDKMSVDIKDLLGSRISKYNNLLYAPNSQRLILSPQRQSSEVRSSTIYLKQESMKIRRCSGSRERVMKTEVKQMPVEREGGSKDRMVTQSQREGSRPTSREGSQPISKLSELQHKMNRKLHSFLFKIELPDNSRVTSREAKKRVRYTQETENVSIDKSQHIDCNKNEEGHSPLLKSSKPQGRQQKIPEFIRVNLEIEEKKTKQIPKASQIFAERRAKSVIRLKKNRLQSSKQRGVSKQKSHEKDPQYKKFATIQPEVTQKKISDKCERKLIRVEKCCGLVKQQRSQVRRHKRRLITEKIFGQGNLCGWNNQQNEDLNYF